MFNWPGDSRFHALRRPVFADPECFDIMNECFEK